MTTAPNTPVHPTVAVIGGTGHTRRRVAGRLRARGVDVHIGSRSGSPSFHWEKPETWAPVLHGCTAADVADHLLTATEPAGETLDLAGPQLLTFAEVATELSTVMGRPVLYQPVSTDEFVELAVDAGMPREEVEALGVVFEQIFDGRNTYTADTVERVLGRPAGDFAVYVRRAAASGAWSLEESPEGIRS